MQLLLCLVLIILFSVIFIIPPRGKQWFSTALLFGGVTLCVFAVVLFFKQGNPVTLEFTLGMLGTTQLYIDALSIFFLALISVAASTAFLFSGKYLQAYTGKKSNREISLHYISYLLLYFSMAGVVIFRDAGSFLFSWELMGISSFMIIILEGEIKEKLKAAIQYLVQMHIGFFLLVVAFVLVDSKTGEFGFQGLVPFFSGNNNLPLFILFFLGFGIKAGFFPLHTWLPETHSIAPGNVSAFMSGAVIKMGIYGLIRVLSSLQNHLLEVGGILLIISVITGLYGIAMAVIQKDIKRLLAYSSIENIGIIGIGLSTGLLGQYWNNYVLMVAGYTGALIHTFNHSLFKSALFFSAGLLSKAVHTQNMDKMGGVIKRMPKTSAFFLFGALGICALPPLNGFVSEFLLYNGFFTSIASADILVNSLMVVAIIALALIGGLSVMAFAKAFGVAFLGEPRSKAAADIREESKASWAALLVPFIIGIFPYVFIKVYYCIAEQVFAIDSVEGYMVMQDFVSIYNKLFIVNIVLLAVIALIYFVRRRVIRQHTIGYGPTWGCGYTAINAKLQYTSASFVSDFAHLTHPVTRYKREMKPIAEDEIFPKAREYEGESNDVVRMHLINRPAIWLNRRISRLAIFQTGKVQHYISYALLFMALIFVLTFFNLI